MYSKNLITSAKFLGSGMKWEPSEPVSPKIVKTWKITLTKAINTLCKHLTMFCVDNNDPFHSV